MHFKSLIHHLEHMKCLYKNISIANDSSPAWTSLRIEKKKKKIGYLLAHVTKVQNTIVESVTWGQ